MSTVIRRIYDDDDDMMICERL